MSNLEQALARAAEGWIIFPSDLTRGKKPHIRGWNTGQATRDPRRIRDWWTRWPDAGISAVTDGLVVVDIDIKDGGVGDASFDVLVVNHPEAFPPTRIHKTASGGRHAIYRADPARLVDIDQVDLAEDVNTRVGTRGQIVLPGTPGYEVMDDREPANAPSALLDLLRQVQHHEEVIKRGYGPRPGEPHEAWCRRRIRELSAETVRTGNRDRHLTKLAGYAALVSETIEEVESTLAGANINCTPPLPDADVHKIAVSIWQREQRKIKRARTRPWDETGTGERVLDLHGDKTRSIGGLWHVWDGMRYAPDDQEAQLFGLIRDTVNWELRQLSDDYKQQERHRRDARRHRYHRAVANHLKTEAAIIVVDTSDLDPPGVLNTQSGVLDLQTGTMVGHYLHAGPQAAVHTHVTSVPYIEDAPEPIRWLQFLQEISSNDPEWVRYLQCVLGYALLGHAEEELAFFLVGANGQNGKSVLLDVLRMVLGQGYIRDMPASLIQGDGKRDAGDNDALARLMGARLLLCSELDAGEALRAGTFKALTGRDSIRTKFMYERTFEIQPRAVPFIATNHKPRIRRADDKAIWRRLKVIPFDAEFYYGGHPERDPMLRMKLAAEREGILSWLVQGARMHQRNSVAKWEPPRVAAAIAEYQAEEDVLQAWLDARTERTTTPEAGSQDAYDDYRAWCDTQGIRPWASNQFSPALERKGHIKHTDNRGKKRWNLRLIG